MFFRELGLNPRETYMISFVGGGGKTSHMLHLSKELKEFGNVLITTTTKILLPDKKDYDNLVILEEENLKVSSGVTLLAQSINPDGKIFGVDKELLDNLYKEKIFQFILVEADGAKEKPLKAPNETEPIIPDNTDINIGIIGVDALDRRVEEVCFREELFKDITGKDKTDLVDKDAIIDILSHKKGIFKDTPEECRRFFILSKCDDVTSREKAKNILKYLLGIDSISRLFFSSIHENFIKRVYANVTGIIMASGLSRRMGSNKLLLKLKERTIIENVVRESVLSCLKDVIVVYNKNDVREKIESYNTKCVYNKNPEVGQSEAIKVGLEKINEQDINGIMFIVGDQPLISSNLINKLLIEFSENNEYIVIPMYDGKNGSPVIFPANLINKLKSLKGDTGGKEVIKAYSKIKKVCIEDKIQGFDIDTREDYEFLRKHL